MAALKQQSCSTHAEGFPDQTATEFAAVNQQPKLFTDPFELRVLPRNGSLFWTLNRHEGAGRTMKQKPYRLREMEWVLNHVRQDVDTYMSQALFDRPCRRALHLAWLTHGWVDLDCYKLPEFRGLGEAAMAVRLFCNDEGIPEPSLIVFSGRGIYLKWMWASPLPRAAVGRAVAVNKALVRMFQLWGADPAAVDVSRILRVVGTVNSKSNEAARVLWQAERDGKLLTHDFEMFAAEVLPYTQQQICAFRVAGRASRAELHVFTQEKERHRAQREAESVRKSGQRPFAREDWHWGVLEDLRTLVRLRWADGIVPPGNRDLFGHFGACQLALVIPNEQLWQEILAWSRMLLPSDYTDSRAFARHCSSLLDKARQAARGKHSLFEGRPTTPIYTYRKTTIIERLGVTSGEMRHMTRLIDADEKRRRDREARRASHTGQTRDEYLADHRQNREQPWIAEGISRATHFRQLSRARK